MTRDGLDNILYVAAFPAGVASLLELHDTTLDAHQVHAWAIVVTDPQGHPLSGPEDALLLFKRETANRYAAWLDHLDKVSRNTARDAAIRGRDAHPAGKGGRDET